MSNSLFFNERVMDLATEKKAVEKPKELVSLADIVRHGDKLILPERMAIDDAILMLQRQKKYDEEVISLTRVVDCFPWDGAICMSTAMKELFGWVTAEPVKSFFGDNPPQLIQVNIGYQRKQSVAWGEFSLPGIRGRVATGSAMSGTPPMIHFKMIASIVRSHESAITKLFDLTEEYIRTQSIYRGQAIKMRFKDEDGDVNPLPMPQFLDLSKINANELVYPKDIEASISTNLFTLIEHTQACVSVGIPLKRGVLFEGPYGVGKSLAAYVTAKKASDNGWTYLYCEHADELQYMVNFAHQYQPAVIFCEDIDRVVTGERSVAMDEILNIIDGIEAKNTKIIIVLTTNFLGKINKAMLRPGRLDAIISLRAPDAEAVTRLIKQYSRGQLVVETEEDHKMMASVGMLLQGKVPAAIRECVERAKLSAIKLSNGLSGEITPSALRDSAISMQSQFEAMHSGNNGMVATTRADVVRYFSEKLVSDLLVDMTEANHDLGLEVYGEAAGATK